MRSELLALRPEVLAAQYNPGLVKRAERELAAAQGPVLAVQADETVVGRFSDGIVAKIPPGVGLAGALCTCGATSVCRHLIMVVLSYARLQQETPPAPPSRVPDDLELARQLGELRLRAAQAARRGGVLVTVQRAAPPDQTTLVQLPTCTVRFHGGLALSAARCDCAAAGLCEHLALAVWAVREAEGGTDAGGPFELSGALPKDEPDPALLADCARLAEAILVRGAAHCQDLYAERYARLRLRTAAARMTWMEDLLAELSELVAGYAARSARYDQARLLRLLVELYARSRAARNPGELPAAAVLGIGEVSETLLERVRLCSLGARVVEDGRLRRADVYLAEPSSGAVCVLRQQWSYGENQTPESGPQLAARTVLPRIDLGTLAHGNVVSQAVRRRANQEVVLGTRAGQTTLLPGNADYAALPGSLLLHSVRALRERLLAAPPACLRPRSLADGIVVLAVGAVLRVSYAAAEQSCQAVVLDEESAPIAVRVEHRAVAPHALSAFAAAMQQSPRFITGHARRAGDSVWLEALAIATTESLVVLDLAARASPAPLPTEVLARPEDPMSAPLSAAGNLLAEVAHHGFSRLPRDHSVRLQRAAQDCTDAGLLELASRLRSLAQSAGSAEGPDRWADAAVFWELLHEG